MPTAALAPETSASRPRARLPLLSALAWLAVVGSIPMVLAAWLWRDALRECSGALLTLHYGAFMAQTFVYHAGLAMLAVILLALYTRRRWLLIAAALVFVLGAGPDLLTLLPRRMPAAAGPTLKIMSANLMYGRGNHQALLAQIAREAPDVLVFQEWTPRTSAALAAALAPMYPHSAQQAREDAMGQAVFSRRVFVEPVRNYPPKGGFREPQMTCAVDLAGTPVRITNIHLLPPMSRRVFGEQRRMAGGVHAWLSDRGDDQRPDVLIGDFNAVAGSSLLRGVLPADGSYDFAQNLAGFWRGSTWPRVGVLAHLPGIRLDHALVRNAFVCTDARTGEDFGSDHRPVIVTIGRPGR